MCDDGEITHNTAKTERSEAVVRYERLNVAQHGKATRLDLDFLIVSSKYDIYITPLRIEERSIITQLCALSIPDIVKDRLACYQRGDGGRGVNGEASINPQSLLFCGQFTFAKIPKLYLSIPPDHLSPATVQLVAEHLIPPCSQDMLFR